MNQAQATQPAPVQVDVQSMFAEFNSIIAGLTGRCAQLAGLNDALTRANAELSAKLEAAEAAKVVPAAEPKKD